MQGDRDTPTFRISPLRAAIYVAVFALFVVTAIQWHVSPLPAAALAVVAAFAIELMLPGDE
jgi:Flp pilus assembly protein TadB